MAKRAVSLGKDIKVERRPNTPGKTVLVFKPAE